MWGKLNNIKLGGGKIAYPCGARASSQTKQPQSKTGFASRQGLYYIIGCLGFGSTSNVFHALDCYGKEVALKLYVENEDRTSKRVLSKDDFKKEAAAVMEQEKERLLKLYPFLENRVHVVSLFEDLQCVVMPVFTLLQKQNQSLMLQKV